MLCTDPPNKTARAVLFGTCRNSLGDGRIIWEIRIFRQVFFKQLARGGDILRAGDIFLVFEILLEFYVLPIFMENSKILKIHYSLRYSTFRVRDMPFAKPSLTQYYH